MISKLRRSFLLASSAVVLGGSLIASAMPVAAYPNTYTVRPRIGLDGYRVTGPGGYSGTYRPTFNGGGRYSDNFGGGFNYRPRYGVGENYSFY